MTDYDVHEDLSKLDKELSVAADKVGKAAVNEVNAAAKAQLTDARVKLGRAQLKVRLFRALFGGSGK